MQMVERGFQPSAHPYDDTDVVDARGPRTNQVAVALTSLIALATGAWWVAGLMGLQLVVGLLLGRRYCLPCVFYFEVIQPRFGEGPIEDARPPRFANIVGALFLGTATAAHAAGFSTLGWVLIGIVGALASLSAVTGFCMGCWMYKVIARFRGIHPGSHDRIDLHELDASTGNRVVVQFTHPLCTDCREVEAELRRGGREVVLVDVSKKPELAHRYGVSVVPLALDVAPDGTVLSRLA